MEIIKKEININKDYLSYIPENSVFFDIETLGLNSSYNKIYLIGTFAIEDEIPIITLFFANNSKEEEQILKVFYSYTINFDTLITFNGENFDIPFFNKRSNKYDLNFNLKEFRSIDIYKIIKKYKNLLSLKHLNQKSLEEFLGHFREDKYNGGQLIPVYKEYEKTGDLYLRDMVLLHNFEDIEGMTKILPLLSYNNLKNTDDIDITLDTKNYQEIIFKGNILLPIPKPIRIVANNYHFKIYDNQIVGTLNLVEGTYKHYLKKITDYVYLPKEDMIVPKSLAFTIPNERKEKATKENCYVKTDGFFFEIPSEKKFKSLFNISNKHIYKNNFTDETSFVKVFEKKESSDTTELVLLIKSLISFNLP